MKRQHTIWPRYLVGGLLIGCLSLIAPQRALSHAELMRAYPAPGETIRTHLEQIELHFSEATHESSIRLIENNRVYDLSTSYPDSDNLRVLGRITPPLEAGLYQVVWSVTSLDDHRISGSYSFVYSPSAEREQNSFARYLAIGLVLLLGPGLTLGMIRRRWRQ